MKTKFCVKKDVMEAIFDTAYLIFDLVAAIIISFGCYLPVTLLSKSKPKVGLLMIPKACAICGLLRWDFSFCFKSCKRIKKAGYQNEDRKLCKAYDRAL